MKRLLAFLLMLSCIACSALAETTETPYDLEAILKLPAVEAVAQIAAAKETPYCKYTGCEDGGDIIEISCEIGRLQIFYGLHYICQVIEDAFQHPDVPALFVHFWEAETGSRPVHLRITRATYESLDWAKVKDLIYDDMDAFMTYMDGWSAFGEYKIEMAR